MRNHPDNDDDDNNATTTPRSWLGWKQAGRAAYERGDYTQALSCYRTALRPEYECAVTADRQVLLSNIVACRLQLGGKAQAEAAVRDAQQCVDLNASWSKGHVRLASAYAALGKSNDACNALQTALRLDPGNRTAREMLVRELRRERVQGATTTNVDNNEDAPPPQNPSHVPPTEMPTPSSSSTNTTTPGASAQQQQGGVRRIDVDVDEGWTWQDRLRFYQTQVTDWYASQSNEVRSLLKAGLVFLVIYVAFGGRFGFASSNSSRPLHGNYDQGNAYDQYYQNRASSSSNNHAYDHSYPSSSNSRRNDYYNNHDDYYGNIGYSRRGGGSSYSSYGYSGSSWETSLPSIAMIAGIAYLCHLAGINPLHALLMMNAMGGRRRHRFGGGGFGGGFRRRRRPGAAFYW